MKQFIATLAAILAAAVIISFVAASIFYFDKLTKIRAETRVMKEELEERQQQQLKREQEEFRR